METHLNPEKSRDTAQTAAVGQILSEELNNNFCSHLSEQVGEQICGTATAETTVWLVLEYPRPWGAKALAASDLPDIVKDRLQEWEETLPGARVQLIKKGAQTFTDKIQFYLGLSYEAEPCLYRFELAHYEDLLDVDVPAIAQNNNTQNGDGHAGHLVDEPLFLVCTNGKRDQCCAKFGLPVYQAMEAYAGDAVWQTTHTGGHRFAPTLIALPHGVVYGRVQVAEAAALIDGYRQGQIYQLARYRGRSCYAPMVQAAESFLRQQQGDSALDTYKLTNVEALDENAWGVSFRLYNNGQEQRIVVEQVPANFVNPASCGAEKIAAVTQFRVR